MKGHISLSAGKYVIYRLILAMLTWDVFSLNTCANLLVLTGDLANTGIYDPLYPTNAAT